MPLVLASRRGWRVGIAKARRGDLVGGGVATVLPVASFVAWPQRIAATMADFGFDPLDRWQPLVAGVIATAVLAATTSLVARMELAWGAVLSGVLTTMVALGVFANTEVNLLVLASLILGLQVLALTVTTDALWSPIVRYLAFAGELAGMVTSIALLVYGVVGAAFEPVVDGRGTAAAAVLLAVTWLLADRRRLDDDVDWLTAFLIGSDWPVTTVFFPIAVLAAVVLFAAPTAIIAATAVLLAAWMVVTWRAESAYGACVLVGAALLTASFTTPWAEFAIAAMGAAVLAYATQLRLRANDRMASLTAILTGALVLLVGAGSVVNEVDAGWPAIVVLVVAWALSWLAEGRRVQATNRAVFWFGRMTAALVLVSWVGLDPYVAIGLCGATISLALADHVRVARSGLPVGDFRRTIFLATAGAALGLAGLPITSVLGFGTGMAGAVLTVAGFVTVGIALVTPRPVELALGVAALVTTVLGLLLALDDVAAFAVALMAASASVLFVAAALRDMLVGVAGYAALAVGVALQLAVWDVTWLEAYLVLPAMAALYVGYHFHRTGVSSWSTFAPTIALLSYVSIADRLGGGSAWHAVIAGAIGVVAIIAGGYRKLAGPLVTGTIVLAIVVGYESLGPAALVPTWAWLAAGGTVLLAAGVAMERSDTSPLERGQQIREVIATQFT